VSVPSGVMTARRASNEKKSLAGVMVREAKEIRAYAQRQALERRHNRRAIFHLMAAGENRCQDTRPEGGNVPENRSVQDPRLTQNQAGELPSLEWSGRST
jgi:hypothetical protein